MSIKRLTKKSAAHTSLGPKLNKEAIVLSVPLKKLHWKRYLINPQDDVDTIWHDIDCSENFEVD